MAVWWWVQTLAFLMVAFFSLLGLGRGLVLSVGILHLHVQTLRCGKQPLFGSYSKVEGPGVLTIPLPNMLAEDNSIHFGMLCSTH